MSKLFETLDLETVSLCNRTCPTCIRNSHPDKDAVQSFFEPNYLPMDVIEQALGQAHNLGFRGTVILSHYNEPLMDERLPEILRLLTIFPDFKSVYFHTNGDFIDDDIAQEIDGLVDEIRVTLYMDEPMRSNRANWINSLFEKTKITFMVNVHIPTHFSSGAEAMAKEFINNPCSEPDMRVAINHRGQYLLCCDDVVGNFGLGTFPETSIEDYWFGERRISIAQALRNPEGRLQYPYCSACPRP